VGSRIKILLVLAAMIGIALIWSYAMEDLEESQTSPDLWICPKIKLDRLCQIDPRLSVDCRILNRFYIRFKIEDCKSATELIMKMGGVRCSGWQYGTLDAAFDNVTTLEASKNKLKEIESESIVQHAGVTTPIGCTLK
jgi:hypothetical protein